MIARNIALVVAGFLLVTACTAHQAVARQEALLNVGQGQIPNDTGSDGATTMTIEECKELGGKALKVVFAKGDSFGDRQARVANWKHVRQPPVQCLQSRAGKSAFDLHGQAQAHDELPDPCRFPPCAEPRQERGEDRHRRIDERQRLGPGPVGRGQVVSLHARKGRRPRCTSATSGSWAMICRPPRQPAAQRRRPGQPRFTTSAGRSAAIRSISRRRPRAMLPPPPAKKGTIGSDPARLARIRAAKMPPITKPILFCTPEADAICSALEVFPADNPWNQVVSDWPLHPNSKNIIASIGGQKPLRCNADMGFILVPPDQPRVDVKIVDYPGESDKGPFPVPDNTPIEGWPGNFQRQEAGKPLTLDDVQRDVLKQGGDRHASVVDPVNRMLYEFYQMKKTDRGWQAAQCSIFDLKSNQLRPDGWTSTDAAGLPIFPATVRYDEIQRGIVEHAMRVTVVKTRRAYVAPATHFASPHDRREPAADGRADPAETGLRHLRLLAGGPGDPQGPEEVRHVRGRQRHRLGDLGRPRPADPRAARGAAQDQGLGVRGGRAAAVIAVSERLPANRPIAVAGLRFGSSPYMILSHVGLTNHRRGDLSSSS